MHCTGRPGLGAMLAWLVGAVILAAQMGCGPSRKAAVPFELQDVAVVPGLSPAVRTWGAEVNPAFQAAIVDSVRRERAALAAAGHQGPLPPAEYLALSGGGSDGAFGAGLLCGWTAAGDRPRFKMVTGISTGALIAPFAFLGPEYDPVIREVYTHSTTKDIYRERGLIRGVLSDALSDTKPLWRLLERHVDERLLDEIAEEYRKGRLLIIGTTNLDARRAVLWNIGEIAASESPNRLELVRSILIASAAIPAAFPPVLVDVEAGGRRYQEMHVDGGAMTQVFVYPPSLMLREFAEREGIRRERRAYIIRNARLDPEWAQVDRRTLTIAQRAISSLIQTQGLGDLYRIYVGAQRDGVDFNLAYIPRTFTVEAREAFDPVYMSALFNLGYDLAAGGYPWEKTPPCFDAPVGEPAASGGEAAPGAGLAR